METSNLGTENSAGYTNLARKAFAKGHTIGPWVMSTDLSAIDTLAQTDLDFLTFDLQHGAHDIATVGPCLRTANARGKPALVRVPSTDPWLTMRTLDLGASGVIVPMVSTVEEAQAVVAATKYPPLGDRSYGPYSTAPGNAFDPDDGPVVLLMIETQAGLDAAKDIARLPGVDGLFIGPVDLGLAIGAIENGDLAAGLASPVLQQAIGRVAKVTAATGTILAGAVFSPDHARGLAGAGMTVQVLGTDVGWLGEGAARVAGLAAELR